MMVYEAVIGLEVHAELRTKTKIYCSCENSFGGVENTRCCPICIGLPGTLPQLNKSVVEYGIKAGLATNCAIAHYAKQDRKHYFYPDLPKSFQISQFDLPLCEHGYLDIPVGEGSKRIGITRIHIEEDAGKLTHSDDGYSRVDYNRCGVPLIEIVSEPDMSSSEEAFQFLETLRLLLYHIGVSDCKMQEGSLRCDVNVSVRPKGSNKLGTRSECKNVSSFRATVRAIDYEIARQIDLLEKGETIEQDTRRWDDAKGESVVLRSKEDSHDYRYFPEPDLMPMEIDDAWIEKLRAELPELPQAKKQRYMAAYGLSDYDAYMVSSDKGFYPFFEAAVSDGAPAKTVANWILGDISRILKERGLDTDAIPFDGKSLHELIELIESKAISNTIAKQVLAFMFDGEGSPKKIVEARQLAQISDTGAITELVQSVIDQNPQAIEDFKAGKKKAMGFLTGQVMRASRGKANPAMINQILTDLLSKLS